MAPITDDKVLDLKELVHKLEARVHELERRLEGGATKTTSPSEAMRMILIGPPGAGVLPVLGCRRLLTGFSQAREHKLPASRTSIVSATWYEPPDSASPDFH